MFTNQLAIINKIKADIQTSVLSIQPDMQFSLDEPIEPMYDNLPCVYIYPVKEDYNFSESFQDSSAKTLMLRIIIQMKSGPASIICNPIINMISDTLMADRTLGNLINYLELQSIHWGNDRLKDGNICGAALDIEIKYLT